MGFDKTKAAASEYYGEYQISQDEGKSRKWQNHSTQ